MIPTATAAPRTLVAARAAVGVEPWAACLPALLRMLPLLLSWLLVVVGRGVCLVAQQMPPLVTLVRAVRRHLDAVDAFGAHQPSGGRRPTSP